MFEVLSNRDFDGFLRSMEELELVVVGYNDLAGKIGPYIGLI